MHKRVDSITSQTASAESGKESVRGNGRENQVPGLTGLFFFGDGHYEQLRRITLFNVEFLSRFQ